MTFEVCFILLFVYPIEILSTSPRTSTESDHFSEALKDRLLSDDQLADFGNECVKLQKYEHALEFFNRAVLVKPHSASLYRLRAECHLKLRNWDDAIADYQRSIAWEPNEKAGQTGLRRAEALKQCYGIDVKDVLSSDRTAEEFFQLGEKCLQVGARKEAYMYLTAAIEKDPETIKYYIRRTQCNVEMQNYGQAESDIRHVMEMRPGSKKVRHTLHRILIKSNQYDAAFQDMMRNDSGIGELGMLGDELLGTAKKFVNAFQCYREALEKCPPGDALVYFDKRRECYKAIEEQSFDEAALDFRKLVKLEPQNKEIQKSLVITLLKAGRFEEAMEESKSVDSTEVLAMGVEFMEREEFQRALLCFTEFIERNKENQSPSSYLWRGICYRKLEIRGNAIADFRRAIELRPHDWQALTELSEMLVDEGELEEADKIAKSVEENISQYEIYADIHGRIQRVRQTIADEWTAGLLET